MLLPRAMKSSCALIILCGLTAYFAATIGLAQMRPREDIVVNARVFNGYTRTKLPDGTFKPEHYAFADGGRWDGSKVDKSIDALPFRQIAETIAMPLRAQNYLSATDPQQTDLFIMVFWGTTAGASEGEYNNTAPLAFSSREPELLDSALMLHRAENQVRDQNNATNARILGYTEAYGRALELEELGHVTARDVIQELETNRYFVVLKAYDFRVAWKEKKRKLLWETRFSIIQRGNNFNEQLPAMAQSAARHFGQSTDGLIRQNLPDVKVEVGTPTVIESPAANPNPSGKR